MSNLEIMLALLEEVPLESPFALTELLDLGEKVMIEGSGQQLTLIAGLLSVKIEGVFPELLVRLRAKSEIFPALQYGRPFFVSLEEGGPGHRIEWDDGTQVATIGCKKEEVLLENYFFPVNGRCPDCYPMPKSKVLAQLVSEIRSIPPKSRTARLQLQSIQSGALELFSDPKVIRYLAEEIALKKVDVISEAVKKRAAKRECT